MRSLLLSALALLVLALPTLSAAASTPSAPSLASQPSASQQARSIERSEDKAEYEKRRAAAGDDVEKLWDLYLWCDAYEMDKEGRSCLRAILKEDSNHRGAHEALGHIEYDGQWFTSKRKLEKYKEEEEERRAKEQGLVRYEGEWVPAEHVPYLERGLVQDADGNWVDAETLQRLKEGWVRQDLVWIHPDEKSKVEEGLWKCGEEWKSLEEANRYHASFERMWVIPSAEFRLHTTCDRAVALEALDHMSRVVRDIEHAHGSLPPLPVDVALLRNEQQYNEFAGGGEGRRATELTGLSSLHYAYFADYWFDEENAGFIHAGVGFWDASTQAGKNWGIHSSRHAAAQSLLDALDPSPEALAGLAKKGLEGYEPESFWQEKRFPIWYRYGMASYAERYFTDQYAATDGNPFWARDWSIEMLRRRGGPRPFDEIFEAELSAERYEDSAKLLNEFGLIVSFVADGECAPVQTAVEALRTALEENDAKALPKAFRRLEEAIASNEEALREFSGL